MVTQKPDGVNCRWQVAGCRSGFHLNVVPRSWIAFLFCCFTLTRQGKKEKKRKLRLNCIGRLNDYYDIFNLHEYPSNLYNLILIIAKINC